MDIRLKKLQALLRSYGRVAIAYSGGVDSTFLLKAALDTLGRKNVLAIIARSETYPVSEYRQARAIARFLRAPCLVITTSELKLAHFRRNPENRCYYCKQELFKKVMAVGRRRHLSVCLDGTNYDDRRDIRFGRQAAREAGVKSPLMEARIGKALIRRLSRAWGLPTWKKPSAACLASRVPFGDRIEPALLRRIDEAENYLRRQGLSQVRVRSHGPVARIEVSEKEMPEALKRRRGIIRKLKELGFAYVALDLEGYRTGSMHESILRPASRPGR